MHSRMVLWPLVLATAWQVAFAQTFAGGGYVLRYVTHCELTNGGCIVRIETEPGVLAMQRPRAAINRSLTS
jgi:hypothetical protein